MDIQNSLFIVPYVEASSRLMESQDLLEIR